MGLGTRGERIVYSALRRLHGICMGIRSRLRVGVSAVVESLGNDCRVADRLSACFGCDVQPVSLMRRM